MPRDSICRKTNCSRSFFMFVIGRTPSRLAPEAWPELLLISTSFRWLPISISGVFVKSLAISTDDFRREHDLYCGSQIAECHRGRDDDEPIIRLFRQFFGHTSARWCAKLDFSALCGSERGSTAERSGKMIGFVAPALPVVDYIVGGGMVT